MSVIQLAVPAQTGTDNRFRMLQAMARVHQENAQTLTTGIGKEVKFDTSDINTDGIWSPNANTQFKAQIAGKYLVACGVAFGSNSTGSRSISIRKNGTVVLGQQLIQANANNYTILAATDLVSLSAGEYIEILANQDSNGNLPLLAGNNTFCAMLYVGE